jgi:MoxR-like ATPase
LEAVATPAEIAEVQAHVRRLHVDPDLSRYIVALAESTRRDERLQLGVSPRGSIALYRMAQARAFVEGREAVQPDDVKRVAVQTLAHRLVLETRARYSAVRPADVISDALQSVPVPV